MLYLPHLFSLEVTIMSRNITIVLILLIIILLAVYLVWLRNKFQSTMNVSPSPMATLEPSMMPSMDPSPSASASAEVSCLVILRLHQEEKL
jgi:flagellar biogenesis protein FliO